MLPMFQIGSDDTRNIGTVSTTNMNNLLTPGFVLCWFAALILQGALFGEHEPRANGLYASEGGYGVSIPIMRTVMKRDAYKFMR